MSDSIEPPKLITNAREGLESIAEVIGSVAELKDTDPTTPMTALLYYKFNTEADADHWIATFTRLFNHYWQEKMKQPKPLAYRFVARQNDKSLLDVFVAEDEPTADLCVKLRFPEGGLVSPGK
jgi:hypothetical protein